MEEINPMKKVVALMLSLSLLLTLAACKNQEEGKVSDTDMIFEMEEESTVNAVEGDLDQLEEFMGSQIELPETFVVTRYAIVDDTMAQIEFTYEDLKGAGRYAKGQYTNMSGLTRSFTNDENTEIDGVSAHLRYNSYEEGSVEAQSGSTVGVADAYDAEKDMSYMVYFTSGADKDVLTEAMAAFMTAIEVGAVEEAAEEAGEEFVEEN